MDHYKSVISRAQITQKPERQRYTHGALAKPLPQQEALLPLRTWPLRVHTSEKRLQSLWFHFYNMWNFQVFDFIFLIVLRIIPVPLNHESLYLVQWSNWLQMLAWRAKHPGLTPQHPKSNAERKKTLPVTTPPEGRLRLPFPPMWSLHSDFLQSNKSGASEMAQQIKACHQGWRSEINSPDP